MKCRTPIEVSVDGVTLVRRSFRLDVPSFVMPAGTTTAVLGPSGCGKSTLLSVIGMLEKPTTGTVRFDGRPVSEKEARETMTAVFQRPFLIKGTVEQNVAYGLKLHGYPRSEIHERVADTLRTVGLEGMASRSVSALSGGEAQRVALARALALDPSVLLLDEPLASLDALLKRQLSREFSRILHECGVTALYVTHDYDEALVLADRIAVMNEGRIVAEGPAHDVVEVTEDPWVARFFGAQPPLKGTVVSVEDGLANIDVRGTVVHAVDRGFGPGGTVLVSIHPQDVMLASAREELCTISAQNTVAVTVRDVEPRGSTYLVSLEAGEFVVSSSVSHAAFKELGIEPGCRLIAVFKATAVRIATA